MGANGVAYLPGHAGLVRELSRTNDNGRQFAVDHVTVDVDLLGEVVVNLEVLLVAGERVVDDARIEQADRRERSGVTQHFLARERVVAELEVGVDDVVEPQAVARSCDVAFDKDAFACELIGGNLELLNDRGVNAASENRNESPEPNRYDRQCPSPTPNVCDQQANREERDQQQQLDSGQAGLKVGEEGAATKALRRAEEFESLQVVVRSLESSEHGQDDRDMGLDLRGGSTFDRLKSDAAVDVVPDGGDDPDDDEGSKEPADHKR